MNVRGMTDKQIAKQGGSAPWTLPEIKTEYKRRSAIKRRNLKRYQKRFRQGAYGIRRQPN